MKCKECNTTLHYCGSCDFDEHLEEGYCSFTCYSKSDEWKIFTEKLKSFHQSLTHEQKIDLWCLWDNGILNDSRWEGYIDTVFIDPRDPDE
jgi:hypothetical protein